MKLNKPLPDDLPGLFRFLTTVNDRLAAAQKRLLLAVDEYEALDAKIGAGVFPHDLLDTLRESIQTHRRLTWIFAGSHEITELPHASNPGWTSALVSARTIEVPAFTLAETRLLLTEPLKHSSLWRGNEAKRPRFDPAFSGDHDGEAKGSGVDYIHEQAGGWPHLVQFIAETLPKHCGIWSTKKKPMPSRPPQCNAHSTKPSCAATTCFTNCCAANAGCPASGSIWNASRNRMLSLHQKMKPLRVHCGGAN